MLEKLREFGIEEAAGPLAQHGFKKMLILQQMENRFPKDITCSLCKDRMCFLDRMCSLLHGRHVPRTRSFVY